MPKVSRNDVSQEIAEHEATFCKSCDAPADGGGPYCWACNDYWAHDAHLTFEEEPYDG